MTARLPVPGNDDNTWGVILNAFLDVAHNTDGTLQSNAVHDAGAEMTTNKGVASGYASLDSSGNVPASQLGNTPAAPVSSVNNKTGTVNLTASDVSAIPTSEIGATSGVASLDSSGNVPTAQLHYAVAGAVFTAAKQILVATGTATYEALDMLAAFNQEFTSAGQLPVGTGSGTGELLNGPTDPRQTLVTNSADPSGLTWTEPHPNLLFNSTGARGINNATSLDGWTASGGSFTSQSAINGAWVSNYGGAGTVITDVGDGSTTATLTSTAPIDVTNGQTFTLSGICTASGSISIAIQSYDGSAWTTQSSATCSVITPTHIQCTATMPTGAQRARVQLISTEGSANTANGFGLLKLETGSVPTAWCESAITAPWTSYTPTIGSAGWVIGNGTTVVPTDT